MEDLIILVADKNTEFLLRGLLPRIPIIEGINGFDFKIIQHPGRDPGVYNFCDEFLRGFINQYNYSIVILDNEGSGQENITSDIIEQNIEDRLSKNGWDDRSIAVVINPELENWIWVNEFHLHQTINWNKRESVYRWLRTNGWMDEADLKPSQPKEAFESLLKITKTPRSSSIYLEVASSSSYKDCIDPSFIKLISTLQSWFGNNT